MTCAQGLLRLLGGGGGGARSWSATGLAILKQKGKNVFGVMRFDTVTLFSFDFSQTFSSPCWLRIMLHVLFSLLDVPFGVKVSLVFYNVWFDSGSFVKLL